MYSLESRHLLNADASDFCRDYYLEAQHYATQLDLTLTKHLIYVSIPTQTLYHINEWGECIDSYSVCTSKKDPSCVEGSWGTPLGMHYVSHKIGEGQPEGMVFVSREPVKHISEYPPAEQKPGKITSRIMRLTGLEPGKNVGTAECDSFGRYIYIHGTPSCDPDEDGYGRPRSLGCVVICDPQMVELFDKTPEGTYVFITNRIAPERPLAPNDPCGSCMSWAYQPDIIDADAHII